MSSRQAFLLIALGVLAWGLFHAVGSFLGGGKLVHDYRRFLVVIACVVAFLGFWAAMLVSRSRRLAREAKRDDAV